MIAIIDYEAGNLTSVLRAVSHIGFDCKITKNIKEIENAERIIFPGVGEAGASMNNLNETGVGNAIVNAYHSGKPVLGICVGCQIILSRSDESDTTCLGLLKGNVLRFPSDMKDEAGHALKIPHMGWNAISIVKDHPIFKGIKPEDAVYFVHSYYPVPEDDGNVLAKTNYGITFSSVIGRDNLVATQFHLEKSGKPGLAMLKNFCEWKI